MKEDAPRIKAALEGDSRAFEALVRSHQDRLYNSIVYVIGCRAEAEDVCQEAFIQAYLKLDTYQGKSPFYSWLYRIAFNFAISRLRRKKVEVSIEAAREAAGVEPFDETENAEERLFREERAQLVHEALQELSEEHRGVMILREMDDQSYDDISDMMDMPIGTVRSRIHRARGQLKNKLKRLLAETFEE